MIKFDPVVRFLKGQIYSKFCLNRRLSIVFKMDKISRNFGHLVSLFWLILDKIRSKVGFWWQVWRFFFSQEKLKFLLNFWGSFTQIFKNLKSVEKSAENRRFFFWRKFWRKHALEARNLEWNTISGIFCPFLGLLGNITGGQKF